MFNIFNKKGVFMNIHFPRLASVALLFVTSVVSASYNLEPCMESQCVTNFKNMKKYARHSIPMATEALGNFYLFGYGTAKDEVKALKYFERTAKHGSPTAQYKTGVMYIFGVGKKNLTRGVKWLEWSAKNDYFEAAYTLGLLYYHGDVLEKDHNKALNWFEMAAENGHAKAQFTVGQFYEAGHVVSRNVDKATDFYQKSVHHNEDSKQRLVALNKDIPAPKRVDDDIEHIEIQSMPLQEVIDLKLAGMKNIELAGYGKRPNPACRNAKISCTDIKEIPKGFGFRELFDASYVKH